MGAPITSITTVSVYFSQILTNPSSAENTISQLDTYVAPRPSFWSDRGGATSQLGF